MRKPSTFHPDVRSFEPAIVTADRIHTMEPGHPVVEALAVAGPDIVAAGTVEECRTRLTELGFGGVARRCELSGVVVPGFIDAHAHPLMHGQLMTWVDCGPQKAAGIPEMVALLREAAARTPRGLPVRGFGYEHRNLRERRHPTRFELDQVATDREVYVMNASGHGGVVNSFTFAAHGVTRDTPNPQGGEFFRDADGELTGELSDAACNVLTGVGGVKIGHHGPNFHLADAPAEHVRQLVAAQEDFLRGGVTAIGDAQVSSREFDTYLRVAEAGALKLRVNMYLLSHLLGNTLELGLHGAFGNDRLAVTGIKLYADGTLGGWTAYFPEGYLDDPCRKGQLYHSPEEYRELLRSAHAVGLQTATHAQSPTAIGMVLDAVEAALAERPDTDARHRIEHCGLPDDEQIARMAELGVLPVNQPQHHYNWGEGVTAAIGTPGERFNPLGEFVAAGVPVTISSDAPVAEPRPLEAIQAAVTRITRRGVRLGPDRLLIDVHTALRAHTLNAARAVGREDDLGSLRAGKRADFTLLADDPYTTPPEEIAAIEVRETWIGGQREYRAG
jgi:predicted amidohydrolase YtcJ